MKRISKTEGYTVVELMIAMVCGLLLVAAASATYVTQNRSYVTQDSVSEINTQAKIAHDMISNDIKGAGFGVPDDMDEDPINGYTTLIIPTDNTNSPDAITLIGGFRMVGALYPVTEWTCGDAVQRAAVNAQIDHTGSISINTSDRSFLTIDGIDYVEVDGCAMTDDGCDPGATVSFDRPLIGTHRIEDSDNDGACNGRPVYLVEDLTYCVDGDSVLRRIWRGADPADCSGTDTSDNEPIAENIEDLQFAYAIDATGPDGIPDGAVDDQNDDDKIDGADFVDGNNASIVADPSVIKAVRINVLARTGKSDENYEGLGYPPDQIENRTHDLYYDDFRRRWLQKIVTIRNQLEE